MDICHALNASQHSAGQVLQHSLTRKIALASARYSQQGSKDDIGKEGLPALLRILICLFEYVQLDASVDVGAMFESLPCTAHLDRRCDADVEAVCSTLEQLLAGVLGCREDHNLQSTCQSLDKCQHGCLPANMQANREKPIRSDSSLPSHLAVLSGEPGLQPCIGKWHQLICIEIAINMSLHCN